MRELEKMLNTKPKDKTSEWLQKVLPFDYIRYISNLKGNLKVGDIVVTIRGGFGSGSGGSIFKVYSVSENFVYLCVLGCKHPELELPENISKRYMLKHDEIITSVINITGAKLVKFFIR